MSRRFRVWWFRFSHRWREYWARKYTGQGKREIDRLRDDELVYRVFDYIFQTRMSFNPELGDQDCSSLNPSEAAVWYCFEADSEIADETGVSFRIGINDLTLCPVWDNGPNLSRHRPVG